MVCTFFGHRKIYEDIEEKLRQKIIELIENEKVDVFYVGNQGDFDRIVYKTLKELAQVYSHIQYAVVLAYMPAVCSGVYDMDYTHTLYPEGLETVPKKFAIDRRNMWLIQHSDIVVTYVRHVTSGSFKFKEIAIKKRKRVIEIADKA